MKRGLLALALLAISCAGEGPTTPPALPSPGPTLAPPTPIPALQLVFMSPPPPPPPTTLPSPPRSRRCDVGFGGMPIEPRPSDPGWQTFEAVPLDANRNPVEAACRDEVIGAASRLGTVGPEWSVTITSEPTPYPPGGPEPHPGADPYFFHIKAGFGGIVRACTRFSPPRCPRLVF